MSTAQQIPLGFSDLTQDECLLIALFRRWCSIGPTRAIAEHRLASLLQADDIHPALDSLFRLFGKLPQGARPGSTPGVPRGAPHGGTRDTDGETDLLSESEEDLLNMLSAGDHPDRDLALVRQCRHAIENSGIRLRPASAIDRSGRDEILLRAAESFQVAYGVFR